MHPIAVRPIGNLVAGGHDVGGIRAQHGQNAFAIWDFAALTRASSGLFRSLEGLLSVRHRGQRERERRRGQ